MDAYRRALLDRAGRSCMQRDFPAVSVRRVAQDAATSTRAVYSLFGAKDGLLRALYIEGLDTLRLKTEAVPVTDNPLADVLELARAYRASAMHNRTSTASCSTGSRDGRPPQPTGRPRAEPSGRWVPLLDVRPRRDYSDPTPAASPCSCGHSSTALRPSSSPAT